MLDVQIMLYGVLFMMAGAYTLSKNGHVRGDVLYGFFRPRTQATLDLILYFLFFLPGVVAMTWAGWTYFQESLAIREQTFNADPIPVYPFKFFIPFAGAILLLQGFVEIARCIICIRDGEWPSREQDVEEVDVDKLKAMVHADEHRGTGRAAGREGEPAVKIRKELWFGFSLMAHHRRSPRCSCCVSVERIERGHIGLLMLSLVVVAIMLGFPTAFTLMGMGMIFTWLAYDRNTTHTLDLMVQATFKTMGNDVLIAIPLFVFMGYLVERANLIEKLFRSIHLALARLPGALAVATLVTCAIFATATGIVGAVVTLMGLLALPAMLQGRLQRAPDRRRHHRRRLPGHPDPAVGAADRLRRDRRRVGGAALRRRVLPRPDAGRPVHPVRDHRGEDQAVDGAAAVRRGPLRAAAAADAEDHRPRRHAHAVAGLLAALKGSSNQDVPTGYLLRQLLRGVRAAAAVRVRRALELPQRSPSRWRPRPTYEGLTRMGESGTPRRTQQAGGLAEPPAAGGLAEPPAAGGLAEPPAEGGLAEPPAEGGLAEAAGAGRRRAEPSGPRRRAASRPAREPSGAAGAQPPRPRAQRRAPERTREASRTWWITFAVFAALLGALLRAC